ncbi:MAG: gamma-glutamylcyclotransferase [Pseudomonadota bacterium]
MPRLSLPGGLATLPTDSQGRLHLFAYGSLIWNPDFTPVDCQRARIYGYHRHFCVRSIRYRGTQAFAGLVLGLDRGGSCHGMRMTIAADDIDKVAPRLFEREMSLPVYRPTCLPVFCEDRRPVLSLTFVADQTSAYYVRYDPAHTAQIIARARGARGTNRAYLLQTLKALQDNDIHCPHLEKLAHVVQSPGSG